MMTMWPRRENMGRNAMSLLGGGFLASSEYDSVLETFQVKLKISLVSLELKA